MTLRFSRLVALLALTFLPALASAQSLTIVQPAAGSQVGDTFDVKVKGAPRSSVTVLIDGEELASFMLDTSGAGAVKVAAPTTEKFRLELQQLDGGEVVASTSIRLSRSSAAGSTPPPPPPTDVEQPDAQQSTTDADTPPAPPVEVDASGNELPPPPPPPEEFGASTNEEPATEEVAPPPPVEGSDDEYEADEEESAGLQTTRRPANQPLPPGGGTRILRIVVQGLAAFFAVPTAWVLGAVGVGIITGFDSGDDIERAIGISFAVSGILGGSAAVWVSGEYLKGNGSFLATLLGSTAVTGIVMMMFIAENENDFSEDDALLMGAAMGSMIGIGGAIAGYELTSDTDADYSKSTGVRDAVISAGPTADGHGVMLGIGGRF